MGLGLNVGSGLWILNVTHIWLITTTKELLFELLAISKSMGAENIPN